MKICHVCLPPSLFTPVALPPLLCLSSPLFPLPSLIQALISYRLDLCASFPAPPLLGPASPFTLVQMDRIAFQVILQNRTQVLGTALFTDT